MRVIADLHLHTTASDGELSPSDLVALAPTQGLTTLAITDHDTLSGLEQALRAGLDHQVDVIPGVEISAIYDPGTLHILGLFPHYPEGLEEWLSRIQRGREERLPRMIQRLKDLGVDLDTQDVRRLAGSAQIGRPHIARALIEKGYVRDFEEAFARYLAKGRPAYVDKEKLGPGEAIDLIRTFGGLPVLAHPFTLGLGDQALKAFVRDLARAGLAGIEVYYPEHTPSQTRLYASLASTFSLAATGGTDFHGPARNKVAPGDFGLDADRLADLHRRLYQCG